MALVRRWITVAATGYVFLYYSELLFWANYDPAGMSPPSLAAQYILYSLLTYIFLCVVSAFRVRSFSSLFLAGAVYGWLVEGVVVTTMYDRFPVQISWTGLSWHALITVCLGWYGVRSTLRRHRRIHSVWLSLGLGLFYGFWSVFWWNEEPAASLASFALYVFVTTSLLLIAYSVLGGVERQPFTPTRTERIGLGFIALLYYFGVTVPGRPEALWILPPLLGAVWILLRINRSLEVREDAIQALQGALHPADLAILLLFPLTAVLVYALCLRLDWSPAANLLVYYTTTPAGFLLFLLSAYRIGRRAFRESRHPPERDAGGTTEPSAGMEREGVHCEAEQREKGQPE